MRHRKKTIKLGRTSAHRDALLSSLVCNLITASRIVTTISKAKAARSLADKMITLGKKGDLAARKRAISILRSSEHVGRLFAEVAPSFKDRQGGYTRIIKLGRRSGDSSEMSILEWVNFVPKAPVKKDEGESKDKGKSTPEAEAEGTEEKPKAKTARKPRAKKAAAEAKA